MSLNCFCGRLVEVRDIPRPVFSVSNVLEIRCPRDCGVEPLRINYRYSPRVDERGRARDNLIREWESRMEIANFVNNVTKARRDFVAKRGIFPTHLIVQEGFMEAVMKSMPTYPYHGTHSEFDGLHIIEASSLKGFKVGVLE